MRKYVKKEEILEAIATEPLKGSNFVHDLDNKKCKVCAVGAVLRRVGFSNEMIYDFGNEMMSSGTVSPCYSSNESDSLIDEAIKQNEYLHALSLKFEDVFSKYGGGKHTRETLARFVKEKFPNRIKLNPES